jgi:hypothetical protein
MALGTRRSDLRKRLITTAVLSLVTLIVLVGCTPDTATRQPGQARVQFDGTHLGVGTVWRWGNAITCRRESDTGSPSVIESIHGRFEISGYAAQDWYPRRPDGSTQGPRGSLRLEMTSVRAAASVEFSIGSAVYTGTATKVELGWREGRAVFRDIPLVSGEPYRGKSILERLVVEWRCAEYQPDA